MSLHCPNKPVVSPPDKSQMINCCYWVGTPTVPEHYRIRKEKQQAIKLSENDGWEMENHLNMVVSTERRTACHQLIQNGTHTPQICLNSSITSPSHYMPCQRLNIEHFPTLHTQIQGSRSRTHTKTVPKGIPWHHISVTAISQEPCIMVTHTEFLPYPAAAVTYPQSQSRQHQVTA
jgi:hypothetical protein